MYRGKCPLCSAQLELGINDMVRCSNQDHFSLSRVAFEHAWEVYDASKRGVPDTTQLIRDLGVEEEVKKILEAKENEPAK
jgi:hypothetical protein